MDNEIRVKDANKVITILTNQNAEITKINAFQTVIIIEKDEEIIELKKQIEELIKEK